jgi:hypothetical protein
MSKIIGVNSIEFTHGGRYDTGFWVSATIDIIKETSEVTYDLGSDDSDDLEYVILKWLNNRKKKVVTR